MGKYFDRHADLHAVPRHVHQSATIATSTASAPCWQKRSEGAAEHLGRHVSVLGDTTQCGWVAHIRRGKRSQRGAQLPK